MILYIFLILFFFKWMMKYNKMKDKVVIYNKRINEINIKIGELIIYKMKVELFKIEYWINIQFNYSLMQVYCNFLVVLVRNWISFLMLLNIVFEMDIKCQNNRYMYRIFFVLVCFIFIFDRFVMLYFCVWCNWDFVLFEIVNIEFSFFSVEYFIEY